MAKALRQHEAGFTLIELIIVIVVIGALSVYAAMTSGSAGVYTLVSQSESMASDLRHVQALATTLGKSLRVSITAGTNGSYTVTCVTPGSSPCNSVSGSPMTNPHTGSAFTVTLEKDVSLSGTAQLDIDSLGKPGGAASYVLAADGATRTINVAAITGLVEIP